MVVVKDYAAELKAYDPRKMTDPTQPSRALKMARALKPWTQEVDRVAKEQALAGVVLDGFRIQERVLLAKVTDLNEAFNTVDLSSGAVHGMLLADLGQTLPRLCRCTWREKSNGTEAGEGTAVSRLC